LYYILLIVIDDVIDDFENVKEVLVECSYLPISVIMVGLGDKNYESMYILNEGNHLLKGEENFQCGREMTRFIHS